MEGEDPVTPLQTLFSLNRPKEDLPPIPPLDPMPVINQLLADYGPQNPLLEPVRNAYIEYVLHQRRILSSGGCPATSPWDPLSIYPNFPDPITNDQLKHLLEDYSRFPRDHPKLQAVGQLWVELNNRYNKSLPSPVDEVPLPVEPHWIEKLIELGCFILKFLITG